MLVLDNEAENKRKRSLKNGEKVKCAGEKNQNQQRI
jgi:ribosome-associated protein YbcJ (S4-like RNA binding protein)